MITLSQLTKTYADGATGLHPFDLEIGDGILGVLGPNGAGKTTLLSMIVLALEPSGGQRTYFGLDDRAAHRGEIRRRLGYLPQEMTLVPGVTGLEALCLAGAVRELPLHRREVEQRARRLLDAVGLSDAAHRRARDYSGGMQRRLGLALSLMHSPDALIVDEPTAGLDPEERIRFRNIVTEVGDLIPVLLSTHIVEDIEATCSRVCALEQGHKVFDDTPSALLGLATGRLWLVPEGATCDAPNVGLRSEDGQRSLPLVAAEEKPHPAARAARPSLEEAYAVHLATRTQVR